MSLIACSGNQVVKTEYISQQKHDIPDEPQYYPVMFTYDVKGYCLDVENAKNLLKNFTLMKAYQEELRLLLK